MLLERLTLIPESEADILRDRKTLTREVNLQDTNEVMTELIRNLVYRDFKTMNSDPNRWAMQGNLVKTGQQNPHKIQIFVNIGGANSVFLQVEIIRKSENPIILVNGNFKTTEALEMIRNLPYFPQF